MVRAVLLIVGAVLLTATTLPAAEPVQPRPLLRETDLGTAAAPAAVILVPDAPEYRALGDELAAGIAARTGVRLPVDRAAEYVTASPRQVRAERLDRPFLLLGRFDNNAVLERLYAGCYDPTDASFPGAGGYELRTVCSPFRAGHNCLVATGSDVDGCRQAIAELPARLTVDGGHARAPFLHEVKLGAEVAAAEAAFRPRVSAQLAELDRYATFGRPDAKTWANEDPRDLQNWKDRNLAAAAFFGLRFWATGLPEYGRAFRQLVLGCRDQLKAIDRAYAERRMDLIDYSGPQVTIAWDLIEASDLFSDADRQAITDLLYHLAWLNRDAYFHVKCRTLPLSEVKLYHRHQIGGTWFLGLMADYLTRHAVLTGEQQRLADEWRADHARYLARLVQSPFYSDGAQLVLDEGDLVLRQALRAGLTEYWEGGALRQLADYQVANHDNLGELMDTGHVGYQHHPGGAGEVLNVAGWCYPGEGYQAYRRRLGRWPYQPFTFYASHWWGPGCFPYYAWELPPADDGLDRLQRRLGGLAVIPIGQAFAEEVRRRPEMSQGGYQRVPGRYEAELPPYQQGFKRLTLRDGWGRDDAYLALDGLQGNEWSYDDLNALVRYDDLGQPLLKAQWDAWPPASRLELSSLFVSRGEPGAKQSVAAQLLTAADLGPDALVRSRAAQHDGVVWTRHLFRHRGGPLVFADEVVPSADGDHYLAQTWLGWQPFTIKGTEATAKAKDVTLHVVGTPDRALVPAESGGVAEGVRQQGIAHLAKNRACTLWTLIYASNAGRPTQWTLRRVAAGAVLLTPTPATGEGPLVAFTGEAWLGSVQLVADLGLVSAARLTLAGCRRIVLDGRTLLEAPEGRTLGWDLASGDFEPGPEGLGLQPGIAERPLAPHGGAMSAAVARGLAALATAPEYVPLAAGTPAAKLSALPALGRLKLDPPVSLAAAELAGDGRDQLLAYQADGRPRFPGVPFVGQPVAVDLDGTGQPDIALALPNEVAVYHPDGTLRWRKTLTSNSAAALSAGSLTGDRRQVLGLSLKNHAMVLDGEGKPLIDQEVYRYGGLGGAFGDVDGDGRPEFVAVTISGVNVLKPGQAAKPLAFQSLFGSAPCRLWLRDLDGNGTPELYLGGGGSDLASYDLRAMRLRWTFRETPIHPQDAALVDLAGDGHPVLVGGGGDGYLYVVGADGKFRYSRSTGEAVTRLAVLPGQPERLAAGLADGGVVVYGPDLKPLARAELGEPVHDLAVLRRAGGAPELLAAARSGSAVRLSPP